MNLWATPRPDQNQAVFLEWKWLRRPLRFTAKLTAKKNHSQNHWFLIIFGPKPLIFNIFLSQSLILAPFTGVVKSGVITPPSSESGVITKFTSKFSSKSTAMPVTSLIHPFIHPVSRAHVRVSRRPTTFSPCPASHSHWLTFALTLGTSCTISCLHTTIFAHCHVSSHSHRTGTLHHATVPSHCLTFTWLALFRFTLVLHHSATLPCVWLSRWLSITLCHSHHALLSHTPRASTV